MITRSEKERCTTKDEAGDDVLCCILQSKSVTSSYTCDVIDPLDVAPVIRKNEHLVSRILHIKPVDRNLVNAKFQQALVAFVPIAHWYVQPWQEVVLRHTDQNCRWVDGEPVDVVKIQDGDETAVFGVQAFLEEPCHVAVVTRPKLHTVTMATYDQVTHAQSDERVKMHVSGSNNDKIISMQVLPVDVGTMECYQAAHTSDRAKCRISASSPVIHVAINDTEPESLTFEVPYITYVPTKDLRSPTSRCPSPSFRFDLSRDSLIPNHKGNLLTPPTARRRSSTAPFGKDNKSALHLVHIGDDCEVKIKLLENTDEKIKLYNSNKLTSLDNVNEEPDKTVKFTVFDRNARLVVIETKGSLQYTDVRDATQTFVNYVIKHNVKLRMYQDPQNLYSILFTACTEQSLRQLGTGPEVMMFPIRTPPVEKDIQLDEGDVIGIVFRGNVEVPDSKDLLYSFHGFRGIKRHFNIEVLNPMSQRSLQTYHGALQIFKRQSPRRGAVDRTQAPSVKTGWVLAAEFPLLLPKYTKTSPVIINKAPVSIRFQEPLTIDFVKTLCNDLLPDWLQFSKALGISHARLQAIKQHHRNVVSEKVVMDVIVNWLKTRTISQDKVTPMVNALKCCNRMKLAAELSQRYISIKSSRQTIERDRTLQKAFSLISKNRGAVTRWRQIFQSLGHIGALDVAMETNEIDKQGDDQYKCLRALNYWKDHCVSSSIWSLVDALRASHCTIVAETIVGLETRTSSQ